MAAADTHGTMDVRRPGESHPFFQNRSIPHRAVKSQEIGDDVETSPESATTNHSNSRKRKSGPLVERPSNTHLPQLTINDFSIDSKTLAPFAVEAIMDKPLKMKVLKLNSNGKLLSSPPVESPRLPDAEAKIGASTSPNAAITNNATGKRARGRPSKLKLRSKSSSLVVKIGYGREDSDERLRVGKTINEVLGQLQNAVSAKKSLTPKKKRTPQKLSHPFFRSKLKPLEGVRDAGSPGDGNGHDSDPSLSPSTGASKRGSPQAPKPTAWKDIVFSSSRKDVVLSSSRTQNHNHEGLAAPWPSSDIQHVDDIQQDQKSRFSIAPLPFQTYKSKGLALQISARENILQHTRRVCFKRLESSNPFSSHIPARKILSGDEMSLKLKEKLLMDRIHIATQRLNSSLNTSFTAFDQGKCDQSSWTTKSCPTKAEEVLQPGPEPILLRDWVKNLTVTSVEGAQPADRLVIAKPQNRKRRRPKRSDYTDSFIVSSEDEEDELTEIDTSTREGSPFIDEVKGTVLRAGAMTSSQDKTRSKNAILISGPAGCGKTASVYAVAKELGFEVFELHPGTRRGAKEILEKVGDMTQNHLVQHQSGENSATETPTTPIDDAEVQNEIATGKQRTMNGFFQSQGKTSLKAGRKRKAVQQDDQKEANTAKKPKQAQKQSLILLEEVDILFEDDKSFWGGVMSLINQSKRPIILTCNDESALPLDDLPLHGILRYTQPSEQLATDYLLTLAATEGHELERDAVSYLYRSQKHDLRSTITELDFWCQMGIGSRKGGLDWMLDMSKSTGDAGYDGKRQRVFSSNTYLPGMGLISQQEDTEPDQLVLDACQQLGLPVDTWSVETSRTFAEPTTIQEASIRLDLYSDLDLCHQDPTATEASDLQLLIAISLTTRLSSTPPSPSSVIDAHVAIPQLANPKLTRSTLHQIFAPLTTEKPVFPPSQGRLAPSLDSSPLSTFTTDLAPYVRSIVAYEQKWGASLPAQQKRNTRASARPEGHFPKKTNAKHVLMTGGEGWQDLWERPNVDAPVD